jgi:hypothetical protein
MMRRMMRFGSAAVLMLSTLTTIASAQTSATTKDDLFAGTEIFAKGASDVTEITMDPDTLGLVGGRDGRRAHTMVLNVVRTYEYDKPGMYRMEDVDAFRNKLNTGEWHCSVHTRDLKTGESTDICNKRRSDDLAETAIITVEPKQLTFIHTIRKKGEGESELGSYGLMGFGPGMGPGVNADKIIAQAEMKADIAMVQPEIAADMAIARAEMGAGMQGAFAGTLRLNRMAPDLKGLDSLKGLDQRQLKHYDLRRVPGPDAPETLTAPAPPAAAPTSPQAQPDAVVIPALPATPVDVRL